MRKRSWGLVALVIAVGAALLAVTLSGSHGHGATSRALPTRPIYGVTIDNVANMSKVLSSVQAMPYMPTTRVYFDVTEPASYYTSPLKKLYPRSYIMGEALDSSEMTSVTLSGEKTRVASLLSTLGPNVDIWEVGNEVNGNWTGPYTTGSQLVVNTYDQVVAAGAKTALTLYENSWCPDHCGDGPAELTPVQYSQQYVPASVRNGLNYVLLSWFPTQAGNLTNPNVPVSTVTAEVQALHALYPNAMIGFGELGLPNKTRLTTQAKAQSIMAYYYGLAVAEPYYIGGYFWWYWYEDLSLAGMQTSLNSAFRSEATALGAG